MAVRQDQVQLRIDFITDESRNLAKTLLVTKEYNKEIEASRAKIKKYNQDLKDESKTEQERLVILQKISKEEANVATNLKRVVDEGKKVEKLDLSKISPAQLVERSRQLALAMRQIPQSAPEFRVLQTELARVNTQLKQVNETSKGGGGKSGGGIFGSLTNLVSLGARGIPIIGGIIAAVRGLSTTFSRASNIEQLNISFETFLGSAEKAKAVIADLKDFEVKTPFEADQVNKAGRALLAFGFNTKELIPTLTRVGDVASGTGKDFNELALIYGKAKTQGLIQGEELNQLAEAGIPIYEELAKVLGVNENQIRKLGEQGKLKFEDLEQVFKNLTDEGGKFNNLMERQSQSLGGLYSTLKSAIGNRLEELGTALAPLAKGGLQLLIAGFNGLATVVGPLLSVMNKLFTGIVEGAKSVAGYLTNDLPNAVTSFVTSAEKIPGVGKYITALLAPVRLVLDAFESLPATAIGVMASLKDIFTTGGKNIGKAYSDARNAALEEERQIAARDRAEEARDERQLTKAEQDALAADERKAAKARAEAARIAREETNKRLEAALGVALKAVEVNIRREELLLENARFKGEIDEQAYQERLSEITEAGLNARLDVYKKFYRDQSNEALEIQNQLAAGAAEAALKIKPVAALPGLTPGAITSGDNNSTGQDLALAQAADQGRQFALKQRFDNLLITEQDYELKRLELKRQALEEEIAILREGGAATIDETRKKEEERYKIEKDIADKRLENEKRTEELKQQVQQAGLSAAADVFSLTADLLSQDEKARKKNASVIKAFQTAQVITNGVLEVQKIWASVAEFGPAGPIIGGILTGVAVARAGIAIAKIQRQKFAGGGYTGRGYGSPDSTGFKPAGIVHEGEYVAPKWQVQSPETAPVIRWLNNRRLRGYAAGGLVSDNTTPVPSASFNTQAAPSLANLDRFVEGIEMFGSIVASFPRSVKSSVVLTELEERQSELDDVRNEASI